jgi:hypothetical protein
MKKKATKKQELTKLTNLIVIDASGSMADKVVEVKGGLKQLFTKIQDDANKDKKATKSRTIVVDFSGSGDFRVIVDSADSLGLDHTIADKYSVRGMTALLDAIGKGFNMVDKDQDSVFVNIITDGQENDSKEFTKSKITNLIKENEKKGWVVTFMGTTQEAINEAHSMGVSVSNTLQFANSAAGASTSMNALYVTRGAHYAMSKTLKSKSRKERDEIMASYDSLLEDALEDEKKDKTQK